MESMRDLLLTRLQLEPSQVMELSQQAGRNGSWLYVWDTEEYIWSSEACAIYGVAAGAALTKELFWEAVHPDDRKRVQRAFWSAKESGVYQAQFRANCAEERWLQEDARLYYSSVAQVSYLVGSVRDITSIRRQQAGVQSRQQALDVITGYLAQTTNTTDPRDIAQSAKRTIRKVMDVATVAIFLKEKDGPACIGTDVPFGEQDPFEGQRPEEYLAWRVIAEKKSSMIPLGRYPNPRAAAFMRGLGGQALLSMPIINEGEAFAALSIALKTPHITELEEDFLNTLCGYLSAQLKNAMLYQALKRELSERKRTERRNTELEKSIEMEKLKSTFFANLSHEFKTPINIILSSVELMRIKMEYRGEDMLGEYSQFFQYMEENAYRLLHLASNMLDSAKLDSGYMDGAFQPWEIGQVVSTLVQSAGDKARQQGLKLEYVSTLPGRLWLVCDRVKVERILLNLLSNALKNTEQGGVRVELADRGDTVHILVRDTGVGIEEKYLPHIFEKFIITDDGLSRRTEGGGLGLSIAKALVEMHKGRIGVASRVGQGSEFWFTLSKNLEPSYLLTGSRGRPEFSRQSRIQMELGQAE